VIIASRELMVIKEGAIEEEPNSKRSVGSFEPTKGTKEVLIDPSGSEGKVVRIGTSLSLNRKVRWLTSFTQTKTSLHGNPQIC
jgi:hypothetical protein